MTSELGEGKIQQDMTIFILVDGIQELQSEQLKSALNALTELINQAPYFCVVAVAGTFYSNVERALSRSQLRVRLTPPNIDGLKVLSNYANDPFVCILIEDMGGHGRCLEALSTQLKKTDLNSVTACTLMSQVKDDIASKYPTLKEMASRIVPALIAVLTRQPLEKTDKIPNSEISVEELISLGIFRWIPDGESVQGFLVCPFVILWLLASWSRHPALIHYNLDAYRELQHQFAAQLPLGLQCWQHWEETTAYFRILKSSLLAGQTVPLSVLHSGALLSDEAAELQIKVKELREKVLASKRYNTGKPKS